MCTALHIKKKTILKVRIKYKHTKNVKKYDIRFNQGCIHLLQNVGIYKIVLQLDKNRQKLQRYSASIW